MKQHARKILRSLIRALPRSKLLNFISYSYIEKYRNLNNVNMYTNGEYRLLKVCLKQMTMPTVFDVGANKGDWSSAVLEINSDAEIHAFEPFDNVYAELATRSFTGSVIHNKLALGDMRGTVKLNVFEDASTHNSLFQRLDKAPDSAIDVKIDTVANYCDEHNISHIDYLKIDAEGNDFAVLKGAEVLFANNRVTIAQFEYGENYIDARVLLKDIFDIFEPYDYTIFKILPKQLKRIDTYHYMYENFTYSNYAIIANTYSV